VVWIEAPAVEVDEDARVRVSAMVGVHFGGLEGHPPMGKGVRGSGGAMDAGPEEGRVRGDADRMPMLRRR